MTSKLVKFHWTFSPIVERHGITIIAVFRIIVIVIGKIIIIINAIGFSHLSSPLLMTVMTVRGGLGGGCTPPPDDLRLLNTTGILY